MVQLFGHPFFTPPHNFVKAKNRLYFLITQKKRKPPISRQLCYGISIKFWKRSSLPLKSNIPVFNDNFVPFSLHIFVQLVCNSHGPVFTASAAYGNYEAILALAYIIRHQEIYH